MSYCMNKDELRNLITYKLDNVEIDNEEFAIRLENAADWQEELYAVVYLFTHILEKKKQDGEDYIRAIEKLYELETEMFLRIQQCDVEFVDYMLRDLRQRQLTLEEEVIRIQGNLASRQYGTLRIRH